MPYRNPSKIISLLLLIFVAPETGFAQSNNKFWLKPIGGIRIGMSASAAITAMRNWARDEGFSLQGRVSFSPARACASYAKSPRSPATNNRAAWCEAKFSLHARSEDGSSMTMSFRTVEDPEIANGSVVQYITLNRLAKAEETIEATDLLDKMRSRYGPPVREAEDKSGAAWISGKGVTARSLSLKIEDISYHLTLSDGQLYEKATLARLKREGRRPTARDPLSR